jgi:type I restriction enzyme S subunit
MSAYQGALGLCHQTGIVSPDYLVIRPIIEEVDARFLAYLMKSAWFVSEMTSRIRGIGSVDVGNVRTPRINEEDLGRISVQLAPRKSQGLIADYLDRETSRIDALIAARLRIAKLLNDRFTSEREALLVINAIVRWIPLHHLTDPARPIVYGIVQAGEEYPGGVPYIKTGDLSELDPATLSKTDPAIDQAYRRARVHPGDIVVAMRASIGAAVQVPPDLPTANLTQGTARVAPCRGVNGRWLLHAFRTLAVQEQCAVRAVGTTYMTLNIWDLRRVRIPTPVDLSLCEALAEEMDARVTKRDQVAGALELEMSLLRERRQAVITAAVLGELGVPRVAA